MISADNLRKEGLPESRAYDLVAGLDGLHKALCKFDYTNLELFMSKSLEERLSDYAKAEQLRDVTAEGRKLCTCPSKDCKE